MIETSLILDTETLDTNRRTAAIFEIGIVAFDRSTFQPVDDLEIHPDLATQLLAGRTMSADTVAFHRSRGTFPKSFAGESPAATLVAIEAFVRRHRPKRIWIQGTDFDAPLLEGFAELAGIALPWEYYHVRDARTVWDTAFPGVKHDKRPHRALADARATLTDLFKALDALGRLHAA